MTATLARCRIVSTYSALSQAYIDELFSFFQDSTIFTIKNSVSNDTLRRLVLTHIDGWDLLITLNQSRIQLAIDPGGNIGRNDFSFTGSTQWSGIIDAWDNSDLASLMYIAEYPDAILLGIKSAAGNFWGQGFHIGKIYSPFNASDPDNYIDGFGIMVGRPAIVSENSWMGWTLTASNSGATRIGFETWDKDSIRTYTTFDPTADLLNNVNLIPHIYAIGGGNVTANMTSLGFTKYLRRYKSTSPHLSRIDSFGDSDQAFLIFAGAPPGTSFNCCLWSKKVPRF